MKSLLLVIAFASVGSSTCSAQDSVKAVRSQIDISGSLDVYYSRNVASPGTRVNELRNFDIAENSITVSLAELIVQRKAEPVGFRFDLDYGAANDVVQPASTSSLSVVQQAFFTARLPIGRGLTIDAGKFVTHMGYEVIESKDNWNYSRSLLFAWAVPYYHTGVRLTYPLADNLTGGLHIVNGWNSNIDNNEFKSMGLTLSWSPTSSLALTLNAMDGFEHLTPIENGKRSVADVIASVTVSDAFTVALNADYGQARTDSGLAIWKGVAIYGRYAVTQQSALAFRAEIFDDPQGFATALGIPRLDVGEVTGTYEYLFAGSLLVRLEVRSDTSNAPVFDKTAAKTEKTQLTGLVGAVVTF